MSPATRRVEVDVAGRRLSLSNLQKPLYPDGTTKAEVISYFTQIAPAILPHLAGRALTMKRYPNGSEGKSFFEKRAPSHAPDWIPTVDLLITSDGSRWGQPSDGPRRRSEPELVPFLVIEEQAAMAWLANLAAIELHTPMGKAVVDPAVPTMIVFDLDPGPGATAVECAVVALRVREVLEAQGLTSVVKSSGSKGLQVYVPLNQPDMSFARTRGFAQAIAQLLEKLDPDLVVSVQDKAKRPGKVLVDWYQNEPSKTTICVYSLRARAEPWVSCPLHWHEVEALSQASGPEAALIRYDEVLRRVERDGDLFAPLLTEVQSIP